MDLQSLAALARRGLSWWAQELVDMLPASWRERLSARPRLFAQRLDDGRWRLWLDGRQRSDGVTRSDARAVTGVLMGPGAVLVRKVETPPMSASDVRRMLTLDIDRLSPLEPARIHFDFEILDRGGPDKSQVVLLGVVERAAAAGALEAARNAGLRPGRLSVNLDERGFAPRFDFLPAVAEAGGSRGLGRRSLWWAAVAALMAANLAAFIGRDMVDVSNWRNLVEAQRPGASAALRLRDRVEAEEARRRDLIAQGTRGEPLQILNTLTRTLPSSAWIQHLEWNGQTLRIVGFNSGGADMGAALTGTGEFANPRAQASDVAPRTASGQPYDVSADRRPGS
jgi:hypothetical protein